MKSVEVQLQEAQGTINFYERLIVNLRTTLHEQRLRATRAERELLLREAPLPQQAKDRLHLAFAKSTDNSGLREAINIEKRGSAQ